MSDIFEEIGTVVQVQGDRAQVQVVPSGGCDRCGAASFCNWTGKKERVVIAVNPIGAKPGDKVVIRRKIKEGTNSALLLFGLPAGMMLFGVIIGGIILRQDIWAAILCGAGLFIGILALKFIDRKRGKLGSGLPVIGQVLIQKLEGSEDDKNHIGSVCESAPSQLP
ncbi:MAG: SoxR reducing system RseC family protein [candidate division WOR-3 bacterium]